jgi:hypothetical protein
VKPRVAVDIGDGPVEAFVLSGVAPDGKRLGEDAIVLDLKGGNITLRGTEQQITRLVEAIAGAEVVVVR